MGQGCCASESYDPQQNLEKKSQQNSRTITSSIPKASQQPGIQSNISTSATTDANSNTFTPAQRSYTATPATSQIQKTEEFQMDAMMPKTGAIRTQTQPQLSQEQLIAIKKVRGNNSDQDSITPDSLLEVNQCSKPMQTFVKSDSLQSFQDQRKQQKVGGANTAATVQEQRRKIMQQATTEQYKEKDKEAQKVVKDHLIKVQDELIIDEHESNFEETELPDVDSQVDRDEDLGQDQEILPIESKTEEQETQQNQQLEDLGAGIIDFQKNESIPEADNQDPEIIQENDPQTQKVDDWRSRAKAAYAAQSRGDASMIGIKNIFKSFNDDMKKMVMEDQAVKDFLEKIEKDDLEDCGDIAADLNSWSDDEQKEFLQILGNAMGTADQQAEVLSGRTKLLSGSKMLFLTQHF